MRKPVLGLMLLMLVSFFIAETRARALPPAHIAPARLHDAMRYATLEGGKRVRPLLVFAAGEVACDAAVAQDGGPVADSHHFRQSMGDQHGRPAQSLPVAEQGKDPFRLIGGERRRNLVEEKEVGITGEGPGQVHHLLGHQASEGLHGLVGHCVSLLPIRSRLQRDTTLDEHLDNFSQRMSDGWENRDCSMGRLVRELEARHGRAARLRHRLTAIRSDDGHALSAGRGGAGRAGGSLALASASAGQRDVGGRVVVGSVYAGLDSHASELVDRAHKLPRSLQ